MAKGLSKDWKREIQRDVLALGSPVFYFLVIGRALVGPFWDLFNPLIILAPVLYAVSTTKLEANLYIARALLMATATTYHYADITFGIFSAVVLVFMVVAALKLGSTRKAVQNGVLFGLILSVAGLLIARMSA